jgi:hypothetical protein
LRILEQAEEKGTSRRRSNISAIRRARLMLEVRLSGAHVSSATRSKRAFTASPMPNGSNMRTRSERPIFIGSTETPSSSRGRTSGMYATVRTMRSTIKPTAKARLPLAIDASFGRNGAPAAAPSKSRAMPSGWSSLSSLAMANLPAMREKRVCHSAEDPESAQP